MDSSKRCTASVTVVGEMRLMMEARELYARAGGDQAKRRTKAHTEPHTRDFSNRARQKKFPCRVVNRLCTEHPQVFHSHLVYAWIFMRNRTLAAACLAVVVAVPCTIAAAADSATLVRVFLKDGTSLVSFGEPARVGDRV